MNWLNKLERKYGRYAIHNLMIYLIAGYVIGYLIYFLRPELLSWLTLEPVYILHGQIWRLISWVLIPPSGGLLTTVIMLFFYYQLGMGLERAWGSFRFDFYIFSGILFTIVGAFVLYFIMGPSIYGYGIYFSTYYINMSIFLAFAVSFPDMEVMLYFVLPIKMKWMALVYAAMLVYSVVTGNFFTRVAIVASLLNFLLFFLTTRNWQSRQEKRRQRYAKKVHINHTYANGAKHKCAICGRTEVDHPELEFRFCSKCKGNYEYCQDHLFTHEHVK